jgi:hypothetical protein
VCKAFILNLNTSPTRVTQPHFPSHRRALTTDSSYEQPFDNSPLTQPKYYQLAQALAIEPPENPALYLKQTDPVYEETEALSLKPTSDLPELQQKDAKTAEDGYAADGLEELKQNIYFCRTGIYLVQQTRDNSDFLIVGILLLFLVVIITLEVIENIDEL